MAAGVVEIPGAGHAELAPAVHCPDARLAVAGQGVQVDRTRRRAGPCDGVLGGKAQALVNVDGFGEAALPAGVDVGRLRELEAGRVQVAGARGRAGPEHRVALRNLGVADLLAVRGAYRKRFGMPRNVQVPGHVSGSRPRPAGRRTEN